MLVLMELHELEPLLIPIPPELMLHSQETESRHRSEDHGEYLHHKGGQAQMTP